MVGIEGTAGSTTATTHRAEVTADNKLAVFATGSNLALSNNQDPLSSYKCSDIYDATNPNYYGYIDKDGNWYILENNTTNNTNRYVKGGSEYTTNWTNRSGLTYDYYNVVF